MRTFFFVSNQVVFTSFSQLHSRDFLPSSCVSLGHQPPGQLPDHRVDGRYNWFDRPDPDDADQALQGSRRRVGCIRPDLRRPRHRFRLFRASPQSLELPRLRPTEWHRHRPRRQLRQPVRSGRRHLFPHGKATTRHDSERSTLERRHGRLPKVIRLALGLLCSGLLIVVLITVVCCSTSSAVFVI